MSEQNKHVKQPYKPAPQQQSYNPRYPNSNPQISGWYPNAPYGAAPSYHNNYHHQPPNYYGGYPSHNQNQNQSHNPSHNQYPSPHQQRYNNNNHHHRGSSSSHHRGGGGYHSNYRSKPNYNNRHYNQQRSSYKSSPNNDNEDRKTQSNNLNKSEHDHDHEEGEIRDDNSNKLIRLSSTSNTEHVPMDIDRDIDRDREQRDRVVKIDKRRTKKWALQPNYILQSKHSKYRIIKRIGLGRFSHVFSAEDIKTKQDVAIKVDTNPKEKGGELLKREYDIMKSFIGSPYICVAHDFGCLPKDINIDGVDNMNYLIMELCAEKNLSDQRKDCSTKYFGIQKGALIGIEMIKALRYFHGNGYIHRDIKPSNFVLPVKQCWPNHLYIVDFGLSKKWNNIQKEAEFIGTSLYASLTAHNKLDLGRIDDLWSIFFVIIDISTSSLPWKEIYSKMDKKDQSKLRRQKVGELKKLFINYMLNNGDNDEYEVQYPYRFPCEYKKILRILNRCGYDDEPAYDDILKCLRDIAKKNEYKDEQYDVDHAPIPVDIPIHSNLYSIDFNHKLCIKYIFNECNDNNNNNNCVLLHPKEINNNNNNNRIRNTQLCREYMFNNYCKSNRPRGGWCNNGYHWTLNDQIHYRFTGILPKIYINKDDLCIDAMELMECTLSVSDCKKKHPKNSNKPMEFVYNSNNIFSSRKECWGEQDVNDFIQYGIYPKSLNIKSRNNINNNTFKEYMNEYVAHKYNNLIDNTLFNDNDFINNNIIDILYKLNVSQSIQIFKDLIHKYNTNSNNDNNAKPDNYNEIRDDLNKRNEFLINYLNNSLNKYHLPSQCKSHHNDMMKRTKIKWPALYQRAADKSTKFKMKVNQHHPLNDENARKLIFERLEEFIRHARNKTIGGNVVSLLMNVPYTDAIQILDDIQQMGLAKVANIENAIKRKCKPKPKISNNNNHNNNNNNYNKHQHPHPHPINQHPINNNNALNRNNIINRNIQPTHGHNTPRQNKYGINTYLDETMNTGTPISNYNGNDNKFSSYRRVSRFNPRYKPPNVNHNNNNNDYKHNKIQQSHVQQPTSFMSTSSTTNPHPINKINPHPHANILPKKQSEINIKDKAMDVDDDKDNLLRVPKLSTFVDNTRTVNKHLAKKINKKDPSSKKKDKKKNKKSPRKGRKKRDKNIKKEKNNKKKAKAIVNIKTPTPTPTASINRNQLINQMEDDDDEYDDIIVKKRRKRKRKAIDDSSDEDIDEIPLQPQPQHRRTPISLTKQINKMDIDHDNGNDNDTDDDTESESDDSSSDDNDTPIMHNLEKKKERKRRKKKGIKRKLTDNNNSNEPPKKKRKKRKIADTSSDDDDDEDEDDEDEDDDENSTNNMDYDDFAPTRPKRTTTKVSYREDDDNGYGRVVDNGFTKINFASHGDGNGNGYKGNTSNILSSPHMDLSFWKAGISSFWCNDTTQSTACSQSAVNNNNIHSPMTKDEIRALDRENRKLYKKELERDVCLELVASHKQSIGDQPIVNDSQLNQVQRCNICKSDPKDMEWELLLCDYCTTGAAHLSCTDPVYSSIPESNWACKKCMNEIKKKYLSDYNMLKDKRSKILNKKLEKASKSLKIKKQKWKMSQSQKHKNKNNIINIKPQSIQSIQSIQSPSIIINNPVNNPNQSPMTQKEKLRNLIPEQTGTRHRSRSKNNFVYDPSSIQATNVTNNSLTNIKQQYPIPTQHQQQQHQYQQMQIAAQQKHQQHQQQSHIPQHQHQHIPLQIQSQHTPTLQSTQQQQTNNNKTQQHRSGIQQPQQHNIQPGAYGITSLTSTPLPPPGHIPPPQQYYIPPTYMTINPQHPNSTQQVTSVTPMMYMQPSPHHQPHPTTTINDIFRNSILNTNTQPPPPPPQVPPQTTHPTHPTHPTPTTTQSLQTTKKLNINTNNTLIDNKKQTTTSNTTLQQTTTTTAGNASNPSTNKSTGSNAETSKSSTQQQSSINVHLNQNIISNNKFVVMNSNQQQNPNSNPHKNTPQNMHHNNVSSISSIQNNSQNNLQQMNVPMIQMQHQTSYMPPMQMTPHYNQLMYPMMYGNMPTHQYQTYQPTTATPTATTTTNTTNPQKISNNVVSVPDVVPSDKSTDPNHQQQQQQQLHYRVYFEQPRRNNKINNNNNNYNNNKIFPKKQIVDEDKWPIITEKIFLNPIGRNTRCKRFKIVGCVPDEIYPDYFYSKLLIKQRNNNNNNNIK